jgi:hypothetical protein
MDLGTVGWLVLGWFAVALIISFALGGFLRQTSVNMGETDLAEGITKTQVVRYMRGRKPGVAPASTSARMPGKRIVG